MSKMRHKKSGGEVADSNRDEKESKGSKKAEKYTPDNNVEKEAEKRARGGKVEGEKPKHRMDRMRRKSGGRVGSDKSPFTSARNLSAAHGHSTDDL